MLILQRHKGERISIGDNVTLIVNWVSGKIVSLGFEAPTEVRIVREELLAHEAECQGK